MTAALATQAHDKALTAAMLKHDERFAIAIAQELRGLTRQAIKRFLAHQQTLTAAANDGEPIRIPLEQELAGAAAAQAAIEAIVVKYRTRAVDTAIDSMAADLGVSFDVRNRILDTVIREQSGAKISTAPEELVRDMMGSLQESYDTGASVPKAARALRETGYTHAKGYAERVARTETLRAVNSASLALVHATGAARFKVWLATNDQRTRPTHRAADSQTVGVKESFSVGGSRLQYPGDPNGPADEVILCRCAIGYSDDANLDLIAGGSMATAVEEEVAVGASWNGPIALEGIDTGDGRFFAAGSFEWRTLPLTLMAQHSTPGAGGHAEAQVAGRIDTIERVGEQIMGAGVFDTGPWGQETQRLVDDGVLKGISVDFSPQEYDIVPDPESPDDPFLASLNFSRAIILGATIVPFPAFEGAMIAITAGAAMHVRDFHRGEDGELIGRFFMPFLTAAIGDEEDAGGDAAEAVADIRAAVNGYPGLDGQVVVTIAGEDTTIPFPADAPAEEASAEVTAALATIRDALRARVGA